MGEMETTMNQLASSTADNADVENVFDAMANAGKLHLLGLGFMCQLPVHNGLFNLPSHFDSHKRDASMQQVISAIGHLMGDNHWRDQTVFDVAGTGKSAGLSLVDKEPSAIIRDQQFSPVVFRVSLLALCVRWVYICSLNLDISK